MHLTRAINHPLQNRLASFSEHSSGFAPSAAQKTSKTKIPKLCSASCALFLLHVFNSMLFLHVFTMRAHARDCGLKPPK
ncbi:hypothetical protein ACLF9V_07665 [Helicobacter pylori]